MGSVTRGAGAALAVMVLVACGAETEVDTASAAQATTTAAPTTTSSTKPTRDPAQRYRATALVLESTTHGPQLCLGAVASSLPPQCGGPDVIGWDWAAVDGEESMNGTTWAGATVVGTFDRERFSLTEPPRPPEAPSRVDTENFAPACDAPDGDPAADRDEFRPPHDPSVSAVWVSDPEGPWDGPFVASVVAQPGHGDFVRALVRREWAGLLCVVERDQPSLDELERLHATIVDLRNSDTPFGGIFGSSIDQQLGVVDLSVAIADDISTSWARERWGDLVVLDGLLERVDD